MGSPNRNKWRPVFYYLLIEKFEKQDLFQPIAAEPIQEEVPLYKTVEETTDHQINPTVESEENSS